MPKEHQIHVLLAFAKRTGKRNELGLIVAPLDNSLSYLTLIHIIHSVFLGWEVMRLKGCVFLPPTLLPVPGGGKEARTCNLSIASNPVSVYSLARITCFVIISTDFDSYLN